MSDIAVLVNGIYPNEVDPRHIHTLHERLKAAFGDVDIYYQTWDTPVEREKLKDFDQPVFYTPVPEINYSPFWNCIRTGIFPHAIVGKWQKHWFQRNRMKFDRGILQVLSLCQMHELLPKKYKYYARVRWDVFFRDDFDPDFWIEKFLEENTLVGFSHWTRRYVAAMIPDGVQYGVNKRKRTVKRFFDKDYPIEKMLITGPDDPQQRGWDIFLSDFCILYKEGDLDIDYVWKLHENKELYFGEFVWHQIFCQNKKHVNVDGFVITQRHLITDYDEMAKQIELDRVRRRAEMNDLVVDPEPTKGYLIVASRLKFFYLSACNLIESIKDFHPEAQCCLVTEERFLDDRGRACADEIMFCDDHRRAKIWGMARSPYDLTFYIDADTECEHEDIATIFDRFEGNDIMFTGLPPERHYCYTEVHFEGARKPDGTKGGFELCGGVCLYDMRKEIVRKFMHNWYHLTVRQYANEWWPKKDNGEEDLENYPESLKRWDQFTLWWLTNKDEMFTDLKYGVLEDDSRWNYYSKYRGGAEAHNKDPVVIRHYSSAGAKHEVYR